MSSTINNRYGLSASDDELGKAFTLETGWPLPVVDDMFASEPWQMDELLDLKAKLNGTKQKLNTFDLDRWHAHTTKMNPARLVVDHVRKKAHPDFLTQAWCKFYEIACCSRLFPPEMVADGVFTVHLCEAPGAFISSLNHYMAVNHAGTQFEWLAMTLNPYHEANGHPDTVSDDRLILNTLDRWEFGPDYTGDIFQSGYADHLARTVLDGTNGGGACLVTADGSVDCSDEPGEQESAVMRLHHYECMVALNVLRVGGSLVLKMFTAFESGTVCRTYLLCCLFRRVVFRKPVASKPGNSEVYVVCTGYRGRRVAGPFVRKFFADCRRDNMVATMFPLSQIPARFRTQLIECSEYFSRNQIQTIESNIDAAAAGPDCRLRRYCDMEAVQRSVCREFVVRYGLQPIRRDQRLMTTGGFKPARVRISGRRRGLSYAEKTRLRNLDPVQEAHALYDELIGFDEWKRPRHDVFWAKRCQHPVRPADVQFRLGKPVTTVRGSKFCSESLVQLRLRVLAKYSLVKSDADEQSRSLFYRFKLDRSDMSVCDLTDLYFANSVDNVAQQYCCLKAVVAVLRDLIVTSDLLLIGYPLYTQTSVASFFAIANMFETYRLLTPDDKYGHAFAFFDYKKNSDSDCWLNALEKAKSHLLPEANGSLALVSWLPIKMLLEQSAYPDIVTINNLCIVREIQHMLSSFLNPIA